MTRSISIDYYRVDMPPDTSQKFEELIEQVAHIPFQDPDRTRAVRGIHVRMQEEAIHAQVVQFDMLRIDMEDLPALAKFSGETEELELEEDQGLGSTTACLYHIPSHVLLVQHSRSGPTASMVVQYFFEVLGMANQTAALRPLIRTDGWEEVAAFGSFRGLEFSVAGIGHLDIRQAMKGGSALEFIKMFKKFGSRTATVAMGLGHDRNSSLIHVLETAEELLGLKSNDSVNVKKIEITGFDESGETRTIDLLKYRLKDSISIGVVESRTYAYEVRIKAMIESWNTNSKEARLISGVEPPKTIR